MPADTTIPSGVDRITIVPGLCNGKPTIRVREPQCRPPLRRRCRQLVPRFLIDVNLPRRFHLWATADFVFAKDIDQSWPDDAIWTYALAHDLVIVTVDTDFYDRALVATVCPKIVHFKLYNLRLREWHPLVTRVWPQIVVLVATHRMVIVYRDRIDALP